MIYLIIYQFIGVLWSSYSMWRQFKLDPSFSWRTVLGAVLNAYLWPLSIIMMLMDKYLYHGYYD